MKFSFFNALGLILLAYLFSMCTASVDDGNKKADASESNDNIEIVEDTPQDNESDDDGIDIAQISKDFINEPVEITDPTNDDGYDEATTFYAKFIIASKHFIEQNDKDNLFKVRMKGMEFFSKAEQYQDAYERLLSPESDPEAHQDFMQEVYDKAGITEAEEQKITDKMDALLKDYEPAE